MFPNKLISCKVPWPPPQLKLGTPNLPTPNHEYSFGYSQNADFRECESRDDGHLFIHYLKFSLYLIEFLKGIMNHPISFILL